MRILLQYLASLRVMHLLQGAILLCSITPGSDLSLWRSRFRRLQQPTVRLPTFQQYLEDVCLQRLIMARRAKLWVSLDGTQWKSLPVWWLRHS